VATPCRSHYGWQTSPGLIDILDKGGRVWLGGTVHQIFAVATNATTANSYVGWPSYAVALVVAAVFAGGYLRAPHGAVGSR
jgi:hypothetical protein